MILPANRQPLKQRRSKSLLTLGRVAVSLSTVVPPISSGSALQANDDPQLVIELLRYLMSRPSFDEIAQHVVLSLTTQHGTKAAILGECRGDGSLTHLGAFGISATTSYPLTRLTLWDSSPLSDAIRTGQPIICSQRGEAAERYPQVSTFRECDDPTAAWPLALPSQLVGGLQLFFHRPIEGLSLSHEVGGVAAVLALYLSLLRTPATAPGDEGLTMSSGLPRGVPAGDPSDQSTAASKPLSDRQHTILRYLAQGRTNIQIAHSLGFSESTIRQETIAIYRSLHVHGRQDAVRQARAQGILAD